MMDNIENRVTPERSRINFSQDSEIAYWTLKFNVSARQLYSAAQEAGSSVVKIEKVLLRMGYLTRVEAIS